MRTILLAGLAVCAAVAQSLTEPPALVRFDRRLGAASVRQYANAGIPVNVVGMTAITGRPETWLIEVHDSFAGIEDVDQALRQSVPFAALDYPDELSGDILAGSRSLIAVYRPGFSYRPEQATQALRKARYCQVSIYRVNSGSESEFAELVKSRRILFDSVNLDRPDLAFYVLSGAASGTYVFLAPLPSLKVLDDGWAKAPAYAENIPAETAKTEGFTREHLLFRVEPATSWVSDDFASADPEFWRGKAKTP
jgi:hypothetical protein